MMTLPDLVDDSDPILHRPAAKCTTFGPHLEFLCQQMLERMTALGGIGLAANQVGLDMRIFVMKTSYGSVFAVNPEYIENPNNPGIVRELEGCLSYPGEVRLVPRPAAVYLEYYTPDGQQVLQAFSGLDARCVQHEMDHLDGVTIIDKMEH